ncbi:OmpH family outer membrane protein [Thermodesulfobacterium sp. TA1]|uniref:OmpH family outer membrane protein n=1 Tax=Thermodesulfobacterium sp. TA1 TaxID=2234087 RepID=UPI001232ECA5|nr:OmpH family outer membrane protein [Thermodesulfobacterium sp. TA1]QER42806.1 OmpH family outer membrane protein [Thermodesulfobacterium sp. TA1]
MERRVFWIFFVVFLFFGFFKEVKAETSLKIGVIDIKKVVNKSKYGEEVIQKLQKKYEELSLKVQAKAKEIDAMKEELEKKGSLLSQEAREKKQAEYQKLLRELKSLQEDAQYEMQEYEKQLLDPVFKELEKVLKEFVQKEGIDLVLEKNQPGIYYISPKVDYTEKLIEKFNVYYENLKKTQK